MHEEIEFYLDLLNGFNAYSKIYICLLYYIGIFILIQNKNVNKYAGKKGAELLNTLRR